MKRVFILLLLFAVLISAFAASSVTSFAEGGASPYEYAVAFSALFPQRDVPSGGAAAAAAYLAPLLSSKGYDVSTPSFRHLLEDADGKRVTYDYSHVIGYKDNGKGKCVLIGCYYDGFTSSDVSGVGNGATNAFSVGTLLYVAEWLASSSVDYDIAIAFWGGIEVTESFDAEKCGIPLERIAFYINFDAIGAGESDYLYADDVPRAQDNFFRKIASDAGASIKSAPVYKKPSSITFGSGDAYSYTHLGLYGANRFFMGEEIPSLAFVGGAWEYDCGLYRYPGKGQIEGTSLDTVSSLDELNGGKEQTASRLLSVANVVINGVTSPEFASVVEKAGKETSALSLDNSLAFYLIAGLGTAALIVVLILLYALSGKDRKVTSWEPRLGVNDESDPYEEFRPASGRSDSSAADTPDDTPVSEKKDDEDDVFRF